MEQNASAEPCKQAFDTLLSCPCASVCGSKSRFSTCPCSIALLAVTLIFSLTLIYQVYKHLQRISNPGWASASSQSKRTLVDHYTTLNRTHYEGAEVALVGVWMSDDINPKLIHRIALSTIDNKTLERFTDNDGYLYGTSFSWVVLDCYVPVSEVESPSLLRPRAQRRVEDITHPPRSHPRTTGIRLNWTISLET